MKKKLGRLLMLFGFDLRKMFSSIKGFPFFIADKKNIKKQIKKSNNTFGPLTSNPVFDERFEQESKISWNYFYQDLHVAQRIFANKPDKHVDIGSRMDGFITHVATFREIEVFDIRQTNKPIKNVSFTQADICSPNFSKTEYCDSLSTLHVIEHFGLGRYGDPVDIDGHLKGINNMISVLKPGGKFYLSTPIGKQRIEFNSHRVFNINYILDLFKAEFELNHFSYINDRGEFIEHVEMKELEVKSNFGCSYGCGIFEFTKNLS